MLLIKRLLILVSLTFFTLVVSPSGGVYAQDQGNESPGGLDTANNSTLAFNQLSFTLIRKGVIRGKGSVLPILVITNPSPREVQELTRLVPLIRSDLMKVTNIMARKRFRINRPINPDFVAKQFQRQIDSRIGAERIVVYIQDAIIRPIR